MVKIKSFVGGHSVKVYANCTFDAEVRKYRGGTLLCEIPYSGRMLNAYYEQAPAEPIDYNGTLLPVSGRQVFTGVDPLPDTDECDYCIVSAMYVAACRELGLPTDRLLTVGVPVLDGDNNIAGTAGLTVN